MTRVNCVIQARMASTRLPGKVMADVAGRPMLSFMLERLASLHVEEVIVATTTSGADDVVAEAARTSGATVVRGSEHDVLERYRLALEASPCDHLIRLTGDCPLADPAIVIAVLEHHLSEEADYTSNLFPRSFPKGLDVEVVRGSTLRKAAEEALLPWEREHVTPFVYRDPQRFRLSNVCQDGKWLGDLRWTVDTPADLVAVRRLVDAVGGSTDFGWLDVLHLADPVPPEPTGAARLVPLISRDQALIVSWSGPGVPGDLSRKGPGCPAWMLTRGDELLALLWMQVQKGLGRLSVSARGSQELLDSLRLLVEQLDSQFQVDVVAVDPRDGRLAQACRSAGFSSGLAGSPPGWLARKVR